MTPAETLAAARGNVVGPYVPARVEWLEGWVGPINIAREAGDPPSAYLCGVWLSNAAEIIGERIGYGVSDDFGNSDYTRIHLDLRRPEVRDLLVRCGAPAWARDIPAALWVWAVMGKAPRFVLGAWDDCWSPRMDRWGVSPVNGVCLSTMSPEACSTLEDWSGWQFRIPSTSPQTGPETGPEGMACADLAALRAGCVLEEPGGWLVPMPGGGVGFWPKS